MTAQEAHMTSNDTTHAGRVLVVEDDESMRRLIAATLLKWGYDVVEAADGIDLLGWLASALSSPTDDRLDVIVSDVNLPDLTALEVMAALRTHYADVPIILVIAANDSTVSERGYDLGASIVLRKPFDVADLGALVKSIGRRNRPHWLPPPLAAAEHDGR